MQLRATVLLMACGAALLASCNSSACQNDVREIVNSDSCTERTASFPAFVHVSRHGMWISNDPGTNGEGIVILLKGADMNDVGVKKLISYSRDYSQQESFAFKGVFNGVLKCAAPSKRAQLSVTNIDQVSLVEIRDP